MTAQEKKRMYEALAAPFPEEAIERTDGRVTGRGYSTTGIKYQFVVNRLNDVVGVGGWRAHRTVNVKEVTTPKGRTAYEAICDITLELGEWVDGDFVVFAESLADGGHTAMSESDARKGAYTNALKKAAAMFGCGRQAYEGTLDDDNVPPEVPAEPVPNVPAARASPANPSHRITTATLPTAPLKPPSTPRNRLTSKQLSALWALGRKLGYEQQALRQFVKSKYGSQPEFLNREQASALISAMSAQANGNGHDGSEMREPGSEG
jgi:hypothetical protein